MNYPLNTKEQCKQLVNVIEYLTSIGHKQAFIAEKVGVDPSFLSRLRSGKFQPISPELISSFQKNFTINPRYITHGASNMLDTADIMYEKFDEFVDSWDLVEHKNNSYLHFFMDENFYKFLINVYNLKATSSESNEAQKIAQAFSQALDSLKKEKPSTSVDKEDKKVKTDENGYLHFKTDFQLKRFVQNVLKQAEFSSVLPPKVMNNAFNSALTTLKKNYQMGKTPKEYVLIPIDTYLEIIDDNIQRQKSLSELTDIFEFSPIKVQHLKLTKKGDGIE